MTKQELEQLKENARRLMILSPQAVLDYIEGLEMRQALLENHVCYSTCIFCTHHKNQAADDVESALAVLPKGDQ